MMRRLPIAILLCGALLTVPGCANRPDRGAFIGATTGAAIGNAAFARNRGGPVATVAGAAVGAAIGADASNRAAQRQAAQEQPAEPQPPVVHEIGTQ